MGLASESALVSRCVTDGVHRRMYGAKSTHSQPQDGDSMGLLTVRLLPFAVIEASQVNGRIAEESGHWDMCASHHLILKNKKCTMVILDRRSRKKYTRVKLKELSFANPGAPIDLSPKSTPSYMRGRSVIDQSREYNRSSRPNTSGIIKNRPAAKDYCSDLKQRCQS